jgi:hypothetical protein
MEFDKTEGLEKPAGFESETQLFSHFYFYARAIKSKIKGISNLPGWRIVPPHFPLICGAMGMAIWQTGNHHRAKLSANEV